MPRSLSQFAGMLAAAWLGATAHAAEMRVLPIQGGSVVIAITGKIEPEDGKQFATLAAQYPRAIVGFGSPGGAAIAGLQIGQVIRLRHYPTMVTQDSYCASACALAWLAGTPRLMQPGAHVGFHAAYIEHNGSKEETGVGNALVGAYLTNLGLSMDAIVYIEQAHPDEITWLTAEDARRHDISLRILPAAPGNDELPPHTRPDPAPDHPDRAPATTMARTQPEQSHPFSGLSPDLTAPADPDAARSSLPLEVRARSFTHDYFAHWSDDNGEALAYFGTSYAQEVSFYGKPVDRATLLHGKRDYAERWPVRVYTVRPEGLRVFCSDATQTCTISGIVDWDCRSTARRAHSVGSANFSLTAVMAGAHGKVLAETGSVISRSVD